MLEAIFTLLFMLSGEKTQVVDTTPICEKPYQCKTAPRYSRECLKEAITFRMENCSRIPK